jgi:PAS domain S-box-containing protein
MNYQEKTKSELIKDLQKLQREYDSLKGLHSKGITEEKLSEERIRVLSRFPAENPDPVMRVDLNGNLLYANEASFKLLTWKLEVGKKIPPFLQEIISEVLKEGIGKIIETQHNQKVFSFSMVPFEEEDYVNLYGRNITDIKKVEDILRTSEERLKILFDYAPNAYYLNDLKGNFIDGNIAAEKLMGYDRKELIGKSFLKLNLLSLKQIPGAAKLLIKNSLGQGTGPDEFVLNRKDGSKVTVEIFTHPVKIKDKTLVLGIARDVTEHNQAEKALKESEERFRTLFENSTVGIYRTTPQGKILLANPTLVKILGYSSFEELSARDLDEDGFEPSYERTQFMDLMKREGEVKGLESAWTKKDGTKLFISESARAIHDREGRIKYYDGIAEDITLRKQTEEALKYSLSILHASLESTADGILIVDGKGSIIKWNNKFVEMWGLPEELLNKHDDNAAINNILNKLIDPGKFLAIVKDLYARPEKSSFDKLEFKDGRVFERYSQPQKIDNTIVGRVWSFRDVTERYKSEESLRQNEEKFRSLMENSADAIFLTDKEGHYVYTNKAVTNMLGFTPEEMKGKTIIDLTPPGRIDEYLKLFSQLLNEGKLFTELDLIKKDGDLISTDFNSALFPGGLVYGSCRDITERKVIQNELLKHRNHLEELVNERTEKLRTVMDETRDLYENAPCGYHSLDINGKFVRINNTELKWLGYARDEVIGRLGFNDLMTPASLEKFSETFPVFMKQGEISNLEFEFIRKDGSTFFVSLNATAIYDSDGKFFRSRSTLFDISERKRAEEALNQAKKEAEEANRAKSEFLANMSHEIRTPMNAVLGYTELLGNTTVNQTQKDYIDSIKSSGRSLLTLINDILDLSKIEAGKLELEYDFIDTYSFFSEFEKIFSLKVSEKGLKFILEISSGTPKGIYIDEARVRQIVFNLIGNAIKFTSEGKITLKVFTENPQIVNYSKEKSEELIDLIIEVQDTGIGVSKALQEAIFEPFIQERNFKHYGGTGLGLTISRRLTALMDGTISLRSKPGKGSIFTVRIPGIAYQRAFSGTNIEIHIDPAEIEFDEAVILISDDVEHNRSYIRDALKNTKLRIVEAEDGIAAYKIAKEIVPDLVITDIRMPKMDGFQLLNKMKTNKELEHIPVIAYSASILKSQKERIHNSEFAGLLIKPVKVTELFLELMNILPYKSTKELEQGKLLPEIDLIEEITNLPGLINSLESDLFTTWKTFAVKQPIKGIRDFGSNLVQLGTHHDSSIIKDYGSELINAADNYNIVAILKLIGKYPGIIENLKDSSKNRNND